jgi:hypothetical protein
MNGNSVSTEKFTVDSCSFDIRDITPSCIPERGNLIDVNTELCHNKNDECPYCNVMQKYNNSLFFSYFR